MAIFTKNLGIDLGTSSVQIYRKGAGIVLDEPSVVAIDKFNGKVLAVGLEANEMIGRTPDNIVAIRPVKDGVIADFDITREMLRRFIMESQGPGITKPAVMAAIPTGISEVEKRAIEEAIITAGAKSVVFIEEAMAAAIGAGLSVDEAVGNMIVDIGGGTTEVAVISLGGVVSSKSVRIAGDALDSSIINYVKKHHGINIGDRMAEEVKIAVGNVFDNGKVKECMVRGRDVSTGLPKQVKVSSVEIREAMKDNMEQILETIRATLEHTPPELASDIIETGIVLTGGCSKIRGLRELIKTELGIPAVRAEDSKICVARGTGMAFAKLQNK